jgi:hypothetical protein
VQVLHAHPAPTHSKSFGALSAITLSDASRGGQATVHDSAYWIEKFMQTAFTDKDPELIGHGNEMTPLAVVAAARWRKTLADVKREEAEHKAEADRIASEHEREMRSRTEGAGMNPGMVFALSCTLQSVGAAVARA